MATDLGTWGIISGAAATVLAPWIAGRWAAHASKRHDAVSAEESAQDRFDRQEESFRTRLNENNIGLYADIKAEKAATREAERDRDRGWWLARWWEATCHTINHQYRNDLMAANMQLARAGLPIMPIRDFNLPGLEDPKPMVKP